MTIRLLLLAGCFGIAGCSAMLVKSASDADDAKAKQFNEDPTRATVYVYRDNSFLGGDTTSNVFVNNKVVAEGARNRFNVLLLQPGHYVLSSTSVDMGAIPAAMHSSDKPPVDLTVEPGHSYFVFERWEGVMGFFLFPSTRVQSEAAIKKGRLIAVHEL